MDPEKENLVTPEEQKADQEALAEAKAEEIRAKVVADLGLTDDENSKELIDKLVGRELDHRKKLSGAIKQKIDWREKAKVTKPASAGEQKTLDPEEIRKHTEATVTERLEQRDLDEMEYPDDIKAEIKKIAKAQGVSVRKAEKDPYISFLVGQAQAAGRIDEAAVPHTQRSTTTKTEKVPTFDMATEEGRKAYDAWKASKKK